MDENLRDTFAGLTLLGLLSSGWRPLELDELSNLTYDVAEAMLKERNRRKESDERSTD